MGKKDSNHDRIKDLSKEASLFVEKVRYSLRPQPLNQIKSVHVLSEMSPLIPRSQQHRREQDTTSTGSHQQITILAAIAGGTAAFVVAFTLMIWICRKHYRSQHAHKVVKDERQNSNSKKDLGRYPPVPGFVDLEEPESSSLDDSTLGNFSAGQKRSFRFMHPNMSAHWENAAEKQSTEQHELPSPAQTHPERNAYVKESDDGHFELRLNTMTTTIQPSEGKQLSVHQRDAFPPPTQGGTPSQTFGFEQPSKLCNTDFEDSFGFPNNTTKVTQNLDSSCWGLNETVDPRTSTGKATVMSHENDGFVYKNSAWAFGASAEESNMKFANPPQVSPIVSTSKTSLPSKSPLSGKDDDKSKRTMVFGEVTQFLDSKSLSKLVDESGDPGIENIPDPEDIFFAEHDDSSVEDDGEVARHIQGIEMVTPVFTNQKRITPHSPINVSGFSPKPLEKELSCNLPATPSEITSRSPSDSPSRSPASTHLSGHKSRGDYGPNRSTSRSRAGSLMHSRTVSGPVTKNPVRSETWTRPGSPTHSNVSSGDYGLDTLVNKSQLPEGFSNFGRVRPDSQSPQKKIENTFDNTFGNTWYSEQNQTSPEFHRYEKSMKSSKSSPTGVEELQINPRIQEEVNPANKINRQLCPTEEDELSWTYETRPLREVKLSKIHGSETGVSSLGTKSAFPAMDIKSVTKAAAASVAASDTDHSIAYAAKAKRKMRERAKMSSTNGPTKGQSHPSINANAISNGEPHTCTNNQTDVSNLTSDYNNSSDESKEENDFLFDAVTDTLGPRGENADLQSLSGLSHRSNRSRSSRRYRSSDKSVHSTAESRARQRKERSSRSSDVSIGSRSSRHQGKVSKVRSSDRSVQSRSSRHHRRTSSRRTSDTSVESRNGRRDKNTSKTKSSDMSVQSRSSRRPGKSSKERSSDMSVGTRGSRRDRRSRKNQNSDMSVGSRGSRISRSSRYSQHSIYTQETRSVAKDLQRLEGKLSMVGSLKSSTDAGSISGMSRTSRASKSRKKHIVDRRRKTIIAPPGKLGVILANRVDRKGTIVSEVRSSSMLFGKIFAGDRIVSVDDEDVTQLSVAEITVIMARKGEVHRTLSVITSRTHGASPEIEGTSLLQSSTPFS